jgi:hypothetical protein
VDLEDVDGHAGGGGELLVADVALEVLGLLVLDEDLLVVELAVAVVAEDLVDALLLLPHRLAFLARPPPLSSRVRVSARSRGAVRGGGRERERESPRGRDEKGRHRCSRLSGQLGGARSVGARVGGLLRKYTLYLDGFGP